jgi:DNA-binding transcriptional ArsR family regulator
MTDDISNTFSALADPTRRAILARLALGESSVTELAGPLAMSMPAVSKHLRVLERAGLVERGRDAQFRHCRSHLQYRAALREIDPLLIGRAQAVHLARPALPYRFYFTLAALDAQGNPLFENWNAVLFEEEGSSTRVRLDVHVMRQTEAAPQYLKGMWSGWTQSLDKFAEYVEQNA